jgi:hypothetical protein
MSGVTVSYGGVNSATAPTRQLNISIIELGEQPIIGSVDSTSYDYLITTTTSGTSINPVTVSATDGFNSQCTIEPIQTTNIQLSGNSVYPIASGDFPAVIIRSPTQGPYLYRRPWRFSGSSSQAFAWRTNALGQHVTDQLHTMIAGKTASTTTYNTWLSNPYNGGAVVRNPNLFCAAYDTSGMAIWAAATGVSFTDYCPPCLISPQHAITCTHWLGVGGGAGTLVYFQGVNGTVYSRTRSGNLNIKESDYSIMALDTPLPIYGDPANTTGDGVTPFQMLPDNATDWLIGGGYNYWNYEKLTLPILTKYANYGDRFGIQHSYNFKNYDNQSLEHNMLQYDYKQVKSSSPFYSWSPYNPATGSSVYPGDSGSPDFYPINGKLVIISTHTSGSGSTFPPSYNPLIQIAMDSLVTGYTIQKADLSMFQKFTSP